MAHIPINHHLRPVYRIIAGLIGLYMLAFGILGYTQTTSLEFFAREGTKYVLGMKANPAFSVLSILLGAAVLVGVAVGKNLDHHIDLWVGGILVVVGTLMLALMQTTLNVLGFSMTNVIVVYTVAMLLLAAGLYGKVGTSEEAEAEEAFRHA